MAALVRSTFPLLHVRKCLIPRVANQLRLISTSKKNSETATLNPASTAEVKDTSKNWVSYGFEDKDQEADDNTHHAVFFVSVTLCLVVGGFGWAYLPDVQMRDWASREGFLELRRRENQGLPLIDRNYIDPATIVLPSDEELGNTEIII